MVDDRIKTPDEIAKASRTVANDVGKMRDSGFSALMSKAIVASISYNAHNISVADTFLKEMTGIIRNIDNYTVEDLTEITNKVNEQFIKEG